MKKNKEDLAKALRANLMRRKKAKAASANGLATEGTQAVIKQLLILKKNK